MKSLTLCTLTLTLILTGCTDSSTTGTDGITAQDVQSDISEAADSVAALAEQKRNEFAAELDEKLEELDAKIAEVEEQGKELKDDAKAQWDAQLATLKEKREEAGEKLSEIKDASGEAWSELKSGAESSWAELQEAFQAAASKFDKAS